MLPSGSENLPGESFLRIDSLFIHPFLVYLSYRIKQTYQHD